MVEYGIVKFFDERDGKKFGFIRVLDADGKETGEEIFFHRNDGAYVRHDQIGPFFDEPTSDHNCFRGEKLAFERKDGQGGKPKACPWTPANEWENHEDAALKYAESVDNHSEEFDDSEACGYCGGPNPGINCACEEGDPLYGEMSGVLGPGLVRSGNV